MHHNLDYIENYYFLIILVSFSFSLMFYHDLILHCILKILQEYHSFLKNSSKRDLIPSIINGDKVVTKRLHHSFFNSCKFAITKSPASKGILQLIYGIHLNSTIDIIGQNY